MGEQRIVLENHGYIAILRRNIVHQLIAYVNFAGGNRLKSGNHTQGGGFAAAGGSYKHDKLLVCNIEVEIAYRHDALFCVFKVSGIRKSLFLFGSTLPRVNLFHIDKFKICHKILRLARANLLRVCIKNV